MLPFQLDPPSYVGNAGENLDKEVALPTSLTLLWAMQG